MLLIRFPAQASSTGRLALQRAAVSLLLGLAWSLTAIAQPLDSVPPSDSPWLYLGAYGGFSLTTYDVFLAPSVFNSRANVPATSTFIEGDGLGALAGLLVEVPLSETFNIGFRGGYQLHGGELAQTYINAQDVRSQDGLPLSATVRGLVETKFGHVSLTPYVRVAPFAFPVYFYGGPSLLLPAQARYNYTETILAPRGARFQDTGRLGPRPTRNLGNRDFDNATMVLAVSAGAGYEQEFTPEFRMFIEAQYQPTLSNFLEPLRANERWTAATLSGVLGIRYGLGASPQRMPPPPVIAGRDTIVTPRPDGPLLQAGAVTADGLSDTIRISRRQVKATEVHALLPYIFFDRDSAVIPARYIRLDGRARRDFRVERIPRGGTLDLYYNILNIVGARVRDERVPEITITGCVSQFERDSTLALRRAEAVRDYLTTVWRIPERRIKVIARGLPANPSLSEVDTAEAARENQRVEISSAGYIVERPVELPDTTFLAPVGIVRFIPPPATADTSGQIDSWALDVMIGDSLIKRAVAGVGPPPRQIDYQIENRPDLDLRGSVTVSSTLVIRDTLYQDLARIKSQPVVVQREGEYEEIRTVVGGKYVDTYNLLLFSFDSAYATSFTQQSFPLMKQKLMPNSTVRVVGHTDRIGLPYYNRRLSQQRAEYAAQLLNLTPQEIRGLGASELLYDNNFPEGRYYSRTVTVTVETPIPAGVNIETSSRPQSSGN